MNKILQVFIILLPFVISFTTNDPTLSVRILFLSIFVSIVLLVSFLKDGIDKQIVKHPFSIFYLLLIFSYIISTYINGLTPDGTIIILKLYLFYVFLLFAIHLFRKSGIEFILKPILVGLRRPIDLRSFLNSFSQSNILLINTAPLFEDFLRISFT